MSKPIIAVDVDDVLGDQITAIRLFANKQYGHNHTAEDFLVPGEYWGYWNSIWGVDSEEGDRRLAEYLASGGNAHIEPAADAAAVLEKLQKCFELVIITARQVEYADESKEWLERYFPAMFSDVHFVSRLADGTRVPKAVIAKRINASYLIDDNYEHCELAVHEGIECLLFGSYGWNQQFVDLPTGMTRVKDWLAVGEYFDGRVD